MSKYVIITDSACDISPEILKEWGVAHTSLTFKFDGDEKIYSDGEIESKEFYDMMRKGAVAKTSAANTESFIELFGKVLSEGDDILYLGFSSGLSSTYNAARLAADQLREEHPDRKIITVDTLAASAGFGLIVRLACDKKEAGASIEEVAAYVESIKLGLCQWFTVDDLEYLKRGGRISPTLAFVGNVLGIKPVLHVDNEGHLINVSKVRGRRTAIMALADKVGELALDTSSKIYISHGDCLNDVKMLETFLQSKYGRGIDLICNVGTVIGAHSGPGTLAIFFEGKER